MHYQIFIPKPQGKGAERFAAVGLSADLAADANEQIVFENGPDNLSGVLFSWGESCTEYKPLECEFVPAFPTTIDGKDYPAGRYYVGFWKGKPPTPAELEYKTSIKGYLLPLGDGNYWGIPNAGELPQAWRPGPGDGRPRLVVKERYQAFFERSVKWFNFINDAAPGRHKVSSDVFDFVGEALAINYRLVPEVLLRLELIATDQIGLLLRAITDADAIEEVVALQKKSNTPDIPAGSCSTSGNEGSARITVPPGSTSSG